MRSLALALLALSLPASAQNYSASPLYGTTSLSSGFTPDPFTVEVTAGGGTANPISGAGCVGYIAAGQPDVNVQYTAGSTWDLAFGVDSGSDTALLIRSPDGRWSCNDDSDGLNPEILFENPRSGTYHVWVATYGEETVSASLFMTERRSSSPGRTVRPVSSSGTAGRMPNTSATPLYGDVVLQSGFSPDPNQVSVTAGGGDPNPIEGSGCVGYIASGQPDVNVTYAAGSTWDLGMYVESDSDTALLIQDPRGDWYCNDDFDGLDPRIDFAMPARGTYHVWVATFGEQTTRATLNITEVLRSSSAPNFRATPLYSRVTLSHGFSPDPFAIDLDAGGPDENPVEGPGCVGYISAAQPDVVVDYTAGDIFNLYFYVESGGVDTTLMIHTPDGRWLCNDDFEGLEPRVDVPNPTSGAYAIWVGTFGDAVRDATLMVTELAP